ncbi:MAG: hypothetical protein FJ264_11510 [Planctomycetes bacterium]|nr:hypothetical protein [Planctomycetota bacterium]
MIRKEKITLIQFKFIVVIVVLVLCGYAGVAYAGYENGERGFADSDIAKCLYFFMAGMAIVIVRRLKKKRSHIGNKVSF